MTANNPSTRRQKGKDFEREIAQDLRESGLDKNARRMPASGALEDLKSDIITDLPIHLECKRQEKLRVEEFYQQAVAGKKQQEIAIVVMRKNNQKSMAFLAWKDLIWIMQLAKETGEFVAEYGYQKRKQLNK